MKIAQNEANYDPTRVSALSADQRGFVSRYRRSLLILRGALSGGDETQSIGA